MAEGPYSGPHYIKYSEPRPFTVPTVWARPLDPFGFTFELINRDTLHYSAKALEECMHQVSAEFSRRQKSLPTWKVYKNSLTNYEMFTNPNPNGSHLIDTPIKWFPQYILDLQEQIDVLISDSGVPDTRKAYSARVLSNAVQYHGSFTNVSKIKDNINTTVGTINPLTRAKAGSWPFTDTYLKSCAPYIGIDARGVRHFTVSSDPNVATIHSTDPNWPKSVIGQASGSSSLIDGLDIPMSASRRPDFSLFPRRGADGKIDYDEGYGYLAHIPHVLQAVRYQPPLVETFPNSKTPRHYVSRHYSPTTPNLNWYFAQPVTTTVKQNWGNWIIQGFVGFVGGRAYMKVYNDPMTQVAETGICPYSAFFPPPSSDCRCGASATSNLIWWAQENYGFQWEEKFYSQVPDKSEQKFFSRHCKLRLRVSFSEIGGQNIHKRSFSIWIQTGKTGSYWDKIADFDPITLTHNDGGTHNFISISSNIIEMDFQERIREATGWYTVGGIDSLLAIQIALQAEVKASWQCAAVDGPTGSYLPASCLTVQVCEMPTIECYIDDIHLDEVEIVGDPVNSYK